MQLSCTYTSTSTLVITLGTLTGITLLGSIQGTARTYGSPAATTVFPAQYNLTATTGVIGVNAGATSQGCIGTIVFPMPTTNATRGGEQLRGSNSGELVGSGEKGNILLEELEEKEEPKEKENPLPDEIAEEVKQENSNSGEAMR